MGNRKIRKIVVYLMLISMLLMSLLSGIAFLCNRHRGGSKKLPSLFILSLRFS
ncbi:stressosome-associated protein Prli42 [[Brevibacterium] frigoritolerans]|uniref:Stressosome-associated protein Prli42 n=1 Tax=Peribacillus frigoritolerans TaxID=450367 RepID=A0A941FH04_9BACI|nr:stressosome-associated protein Prli42 [Peribacillus frigoritolerans]